MNDGMRILLATDGSDVSLAASQAVAKTNWPADTEVKIVSVINPMIYSLEEIGLLRDKRTERAHRAIGQAMSVLKHTSLKVSGEVIAGTIVRQIIDRAKSWDADLIVLGTHQRRGLKRLLLGSTSTSVANRAHCSVRVIRGRDVSRNKDHCFAAQAHPRRAWARCTGLKRVWAGGRQHKCRKPQQKKTISVSRDRNTDHEEEITKDSEHLYNRTGLSTS